MRLLLEILGGGVPPDSPIPEPYQDAIFHTHIYTWPLESITEVLLGVTETTYKFT